MQYWPQGYKLFSCSTQLSMKFFMLINLKLLIIANSFLLNIAEHKISLLINMKMPTIVGIFIFFSRENFMLSWDEHDKCFITSGPGVFISPMIYTNCNGSDWPLHPCLQIKSFTIYPQTNSKCPKIPCSKSEEVIYIHILLHFSPWSEYTWQCFLDKEYQNNFKIYKLTLVMLNKLRCHAHF